MFATIPIPTPIPILLKGILIPLEIGFGIGIAIDSILEIFLTFFPNRVAAPSESCQHCNDPVKEFLGVDVLRRRKSSAHFQNVLDGRAFKRRAPGDLEKPSPVTFSRFAVSFCDVQRNSLRGPKQLVLGVPMCLQLFAQTIGPANILDGSAVDIQLLVSEGHFFSVDSDPDPDSRMYPNASRGRYSDRSRNRLCSIPTPIPIPIIECISTPLGVGIGIGIDVKAHSFTAPGSLPRSRSKVPSGKCPALRATSSKRQSENPSAGFFLKCSSAADTTSDS